jgi:hypothetical protein
VRTLHELQGGLAATIGVAACANVFARGCHLGKGLLHANMVLPSSALAVTLTFVAVRAMTRAGRARLRQQWYGLSMLFIILVALSAMTLPIWVTTGSCGDAAV